MPGRDDAYADINGRLTKEVLARFRSKQADHPGEGHFMMLGSKGQFAELNKKFWKLYHAVWKSNRLIGEDPIEVMDDMIGHLLLMRWSYEQEAQLGRDEE